MGPAMDLRRLPGPSAPRRRGRRATDQPVTPIHTAPFVAQVAGLSIPPGQAKAAYPDPDVPPPAGLFRDWKV